MGVRIDGTIDIEQKVTREFDVVPTEETNIEMFYRRGTFRVTHVTLHYRVNRGVDGGFWYLFSVLVQAAKVLKGGELSTAYNNIVTVPLYPENVPEWILEIAEELVPKGTPEPV
jgi:hypothetical protein